MGIVILFVVDFISFVVGIIQTSNDCSTTDVINAIC